MLAFENGYAVQLPNGRGQVATGTPAHSRNRDKQVCCAPSSHGVSLGLLKNTTLRLLGPRKAEPGETRTPHQGGRRTANSLCPQRLRV